MAPMTPAKPIEQARYYYTKNPRSDHFAKFAVIYNHGDAELGSWVIAECDFEESAQLIVRHLTHPADPTPQQTRKIVHVFLDGEGCECALTDDGLLWAAHGQNTWQLWGADAPTFILPDNFQQPPDEAARMFGDAALRRQNEVMRRALGDIVALDDAGASYIARAALAECEAVLEDGK